MDTKETLVGVALSFSSLLFTIFYKLYKNRNATADQIKSAKMLPIDESLADVLAEAEGNTIPYAVVEGLVSPIHQTLKSKHGDHEGVLYHWQIVEHKSKRVQGYWSDMKRTITNIIDMVPFALTNPDDKKHVVHVTEGLHADYIQDELTVTFDQFNPEQSSLLQAGINRVFGEVTKGYQETEEMLLVGTNLIGIGEVRLENNLIKLVPPASGSYILSKLSRNEIVRSFESRSFTFKIFAVIFGTISAGLTVYIVMRFVRKYLERKKTRQIIEELRASSQLAGSDNGEEGNMCLICLSNPRNIALLDCGHICLCSDCVERLPEMICPVCRSPIVRHVPVYVS